MKDSQQSKKQRRFFKKKKETKPAPLKTQEPPQLEHVEAKVVEEKAAEQPKTETHVVQKKSEPLRIKLHNVKEKVAQKFKRSKKQESIASTPRSIFYQFEIDLQLALIPLILLAILSILMLLNNHFITVIEENKTQPVDSIADIQPLPLADDAIPPDLSAKAAIVVDADSQVILLSKNPDLRFSMASTTKIMTSLVALEYYKPGDILTVKANAVEGSGLGLVPGEQFTFKDLLYAMLLPSANDAAMTVADNYPGGREAFVKKMNEKALLLHLTNTHYADPAGLNDDGNYTTVIDLSRLGSYAMHNKQFAEIVGTKQKTIFTTNYAMEYSLANSNKLLGTNGINGIKTGTTEGAREVLVTSMISKGHTFVIVVMNSDDRFADTKELVDFINEKVTYVFPTLQVK
jgi:D-alanyl-D-alanine carboxypeptidase